MIEILDGRLGKGVYTTRDLPRGAVVLTGRGVTTPRRTRHSIQVDHDTHVLFGQPIELINHSCEPNCGLLVRRGDPVVEVHALRPLAAGEELTFDYASWEEEIEFMPGPCLCGAPSCRHRITGFDGLPPERRAALGPYVAEYPREADALVSQAG
jgi:hypothetical protein